MFYSVYNKILTQQQYQWLNSHQFWSGPINSIKIGCHKILQIQQYSQLTVAELPSILRRSY